MSATATSAANSVPRSTTPIQRGGWVLSGCRGEEAALSEVPVAKTPFTIGREPANDLCLDSRRVSKRHAELRVQSQTVVVRDLDSTNGTFVNGRRIREVTPLNTHDLVQFANCEFKLQRDQVVTEAHTAVDYDLEDFWLFSRMREVVEDGQMQIAFQPIVRDRNSQPVAYEALVRPLVSGWTSPAQLFEAAEKLGMQRALSEHCRSEAVQALRDAPLPGLLFLNTHPDEKLGRELLESLRQLRDEAGDRKLVLEIHEQAVPSIAAMQEFRAGLIDLEIGLAYDDFGVGKSRLLELAEAPPDYLKFDRALVKDLGNPTAPQTALVRSLHHHAADLGIITLAEGLESATAFEACRDIGFTHFQGYLFGRPQFLPDLVAQLRPAK